MRNVTMELEDLLSEQAKKSGELNIEEDEHGVKRFWINQQHLVHFRPSPDLQYLYLYAKVAPLPEPAMKVKVYEAILGANLFHQETGENSLLAIHAESNSIILMRAFKARSSIESYVEGLESFLGYLVHWKDKLTKLATTVPNKEYEDDILKLMSTRNQQILFL